MIETKHENFVSTVRQNMGDFLILLAVMVGCKSFVVNKSETIRSERFVVASWEHGKSRGGPKGVYIYEITGKVLLE